MADEITRHDILLEDSAGVSAAVIPASDLPYPRLETLTGAHEGKVYPLRPGEQLLGRLQNQVQIHLDDTSVSRRHALISVAGEEISIQDLKSRNGVYVNELRLRTDEDHQLQHMDSLRVGIYTFRLAKRPVTAQQLKQAEQAFAGSDQPTDDDIRSKLGSAPKETAPAEQTFTIAPEEPVVAHKEIDDDAEENRSLITLDEEAILNEKNEVGSRALMVFILLGLISGLIGLGLWTYSHRHQKSEDTLVLAPVEEMPPIPAVAELETPLPEQIPDDTAPVEPTPVGSTPVGSTPVGLAPAPGPTPAEPNEKIQVLEAPTSDHHSPRAFETFLDIRTTPTTAVLFLDGKSLGLSPLKVPVSLQPGQEYLLSAEYDLRDIQDRFETKLRFKADLAQEVHSFEIDAAIGLIKIERLPRDVIFYLEGYYAYDQEKAHAVKLTDIIYGKPIFVPYGRYVLELRENAQVGDSNTYLDEIRYRREVEINAERRTLELNLSDRDLQYFPAKIFSNPSGATVYLEGKKLGPTPFAGELPLGRHAVKLSLAGYFDHEFELDMKTNTPYETEIVLKTSQAGEHIQQAILLRRVEAYEDAINHLVEALKIGGSEEERAEAHYLLGSTFFLMGKFDQALPYFDKARVSPKFYLNGLLGMARATHALGDRNASLKALVEVFLKVDGTQADLKSEAGSLFRQLSPYKSVLYVATEPEGATLVINSKEFPQKTPAIVADLGLGLVRLELHKRGYKTEQVKKMLQLNEFEAIIIKLTPETL